MTTTEHTPGPWQQSWQFIVAPDPNGIHPDIYLAEIAEEDSDGRVASPEQQAANGRLIVAAPDLLAACRMVVARWERGNLAEAARACQSAVELATAGGPPWDITDVQTVGSKPWSVLLLYPDYANDSGTETYFAFRRSDRSDRRRRLCPTASGRGPGGYRHRAGRFRSAAGDARAPCQ